METTSDFPNAIRTTYRGVEYRSRFEANFAYLLDQARIAFEYEAKSFLLPNGQHYMPDFWLPESGTWVETRGYKTAASETQLSAFAQQLVQTRTPHVFTVIRSDGPARVFVPWMDAGGFLPAALHYCYVCRRWSFGPWYMPMPCRECERWLAYGDFAVYTLGLVGRQGKLTNGNEALVSDRLRTNSS